MSSFLFLPLSLASAEDLSIEDIQKLQELKLGEGVIEENEKFLELQTSVQREDELCIECIYGYNLFLNIPTTFALSTNVPIPQDYTLGPGDKIKIEYFGGNKEEAREHAAKILAENSMYNRPNEVTAKEL